MIRLLARVLVLATACLGVAGSVTATAAVPTKVVVIAVPDLRWADLADMPRLRAFAATAAAGELSVKTAAGSSRCADGSLTFSAGDRARADLAGCTIPPATLAVLRHQQGSYDARVGALGDALRAAGLRTAAVGSEAAPLLADTSGRVGTATSLSEAVRQADVVATLDDGLYTAPPADRATVARSLDTVLGGQLSDLPPGVTVLVAGTSDGAVTGPHLHVLLIGGPGWQHRELRSGSTRPPFVQLRDLAPTVLSVLRLPTPGVMVGGPAYESTHPVASAGHYADDDDHAVTARGVGRRSRAWLAELALVVLGLAVAGYWRSAADRVATGLGIVCVGLPVSTYAAQLLPWWRWGSWPFWALVLSGGVIVGALVWLARRRSAALALATGAGVTALVLAVDQIVGAPLQLSAPLGDNPIIAGRFHGMGNTDFALMCTGTVLVAGMVAGRLRAAGHRRAAVLAAGALCVVAMVIDAAPTVGDDFGGLLTMVPVTVLLLALIAGVRVTWQRVVSVAILVVIVAAGVALLDYSRPADAQTHVGRFVGQILHGGAGGVLQRKLDASLMSFGNVALTGLVVAVVGVAVVGRRHLRDAFALPGLPETAVALALLAFLGTVLNDSGVVVGGTVFELAIFVLASVGLLHARRPTRDDAVVEPVSQGSLP